MMVPTVESGRMEKKNTNPFTNTSNHKALKNFSKPSTRRKENPNIKKKKKEKQAPNHQSLRVEIDLRVAKYHPITNKSNV